MTKRTNNQSTLPPKPYKITPKEVYAGDGYGGCRKPETESRK
ncbi:hypothetical protein [Desulforamulus ferrireducens]|nr:hypothetical protein [Desulforamulus ferrireducens]